MIDLFLFAKAPHPGSVKTRLAAAIGDDAAVEVYRRLGTRIIAQVRPVSDVTVWYDPPNALFDMQAWLGDLRFRPQAAGDLGERLSDAFERHFRGLEAKPVIAIGADAPGVDAGVIVEAAEALKSTDVVIGPATDGGYYLIGLARQRPELFEGIPWGTSDVFVATENACRAAQCRTTVLPILGDVDTVEDAIAHGVWPLT